MNPNDLDLTAPILSRRGPVRQDWEMIQKRDVRPVRDDHNIRLLVSRCLQ
jgi:hypothetical protein